jgi:hypothetical protein
MLVDSLDRNQPDDALADELYEIDKVFLIIDYIWFKA